VVLLPKPFASPAARSCVSCHRRGAGAAAPRRRGRSRGAANVPGAGSRSPRHARRLPTPGRRARSSTGGRSTVSAASRQLPPTSSPLTSSDRWQTSSRISRPIPRGSSSAATIRRSGWLASLACAGRSRAHSSLRDDVRAAGKPGSIAPSGRRTCVERLRPRDQSRAPSSSSTTSTRPAQRLRLRPEPCVLQVPRTCVSSPSRGRCARLEPNRIDHHQGGSDEASGEGQER
jgi:hypothetical protein